MFTKSYSELVEYLGRVAPTYAYVMHFGVLHVDNIATVQITSHGYEFEFGDHVGTYTDVESLSCGIILALG